MNNQTEDHTPSPVASAAAAPIAQQSTLHGIFYGADGLRAGWSLLTFIAFFVAIFASAVAIAHMIHPPHPRTGPSKPVSLSMTFINESIPLLTTLLVTWMMSKIERRPMSVYGLGGERKLRNFVAGLAWGVTFLSLLVLILLKAGFLVVDDRGLFGSEILGYGLAWLAAFVMIAFTEEYLFRGYLQYTLSRGLASFYRWAFKTPHSAALGFWSSAFFWSLLFGLIHKGNAGESPIGLVCAGLAALLFCVSLWRTGSLWWAIGLHTTWDYSQSFLYGVGDSGLVMGQRLLITHPAGKPLLSGGATGPEGSIFVLPVMALIVTVIFITLPRTRTNYVPQQRLGDPSQYPSEAV